MNKDMDYIKKIIEDSFTNIYKKYKYGTAGFRDLSINIEKDIACRIGIIASIISCYYKWKNIGIMITASHNTKEFNGIKLVAPNGEILPTHYEDLITILINCIEKDFKKFINLTYDMTIQFIRPKIILGMDNRLSSPKIKDRIIASSKIMNTDINFIGVVTTPELHFKTVQPRLHYYKYFSHKYIKFLSDEQIKRLSIVVDCANGSGATVLYKFKKELEYYLDIDIINNGSNPDLINDKCGADYVHTNNDIPRSYQAIYDNKLIACLDGDADRLIIFYIDDYKIFHKLDGDKIGVLFAKYIKNIMAKINIDYTIGFIQTAYANGASTDYIQNKLDIETKYTKTGVKHLHEEAKKYDIGIYFESNGHGTVLFKYDFIEKLKKMNRERREKNIQKIINLSKLINKYIGDAISNLLVICSIIQTEGIKLYNWESFYKNKPCKLFKIDVRDKDIIKNNNDETKIIEPNWIQYGIDNIVNNYPLSRAFVRPSGTEKCVRLYVETEDEKDINLISDKIIDILKDI